MKISPEVAEFMRMISTTPDSELDQALCLIAALTLGTIRERQGNESLKDFCNDATADDAPLVSIRSSVKH